MIQTNRASHQNPWLWFGPLLFMIVVGAYFVFRYQGHWAENDSAVFTHAIRDVSQAGRLIPTEEGSLVYPNGYTFQAISAFIVTITGLEVRALQQLVYPIMSALVVLPAWILYRELTGSGRGAVIATILLFMQPEFLFVILRSSHEKFTRILMFLCLFFLVRSFRLNHRPALFATMIALFYLATYAFIASNSLLAHSFLFAIASTLGCVALLNRFSSFKLQQSHITARLSYVLIISIVLNYLFMFYLYPPVQNQFGVFTDTWSRLAALLFDVQADSVNPYAYVGGAWINLWVYFLVSIANWIILGASFMIWAVQGWHWLRYGRPPQGPTRQFIWLLYAAFALQGGLSIIVDLSGSLASNLQHRIFPSFSILAVAIVASALADWRPQRQQRLVQWSSAAVISVVVCLSVLKATVEPAVGNKWMFYQPEEIIALTWSENHLQQTQLWIEYDERLSVAWATSIDRSVQQNRMRVGATEPTLPIRSFLLSDITRLRSSRLEQPLPVPYDAQRVYDNGSAELYRLRARTPFQK